MKLSIIETVTANRATGDLLPYMRSDIKPRAILPNIAPISMTVERLATS